MTKFRLAMLCFAAISLAAVFLGIYLLEKHGKLHMTLFHKLLLGLGVVLVLDTLVVSFLSNFNLGVILPAFFGVPLIALAFLLPHMDHGFLRVLKWFTAGCYAVAACIFLVCGILMTTAAHRGDPPAGRRGDRARRGRTRRQGNMGALESARCGDRLSERAPGGHRPWYPADRGRARA